ncbi:hypothetical protein [Intestinimonas sp. HCP28S3_D6]
MEKGKQQNVENKSMQHSNYTQKTALKIGGHMGKTACILGGRVV